jgi:hypothetical protein
MGGRAAAGLPGASRDRYRRSVSIDLGLRLIASGLVSAADVEAALLHAVTRGIPLARALVEDGAVDEQALEAELGRSGGLALRHVVAAPEVAARLPEGLCRRLGVVPTRHDPFTGTIDVAAIDPLDLHIAAELGYHLDAPIRVLCAPLSAIDAALRDLDGRPAPTAPAPPTPERVRRATPPFPHGAPCSTMPPPPADELPIPLVRRSAPALPDAPAEPPGSERAPSSNPHAALRRTLRMGSLALDRAGRLAASPDGVAPPATSVGIVAPSDPPRERAPLDGVAAGGPEPEPAAAQRRVPGTSRPALRVELPEPGERAAPAVETWPSIAAAVAERVTEPRSTRGPDSGPASSPRSSRGPGSPPRSRRTIPPPVDPQRWSAAGLPTALLEAPPSTIPEPADAVPSLRGAASRDDVVREALSGMTAVSPRAAVFAVRRDAYHGWACSAAFGDQAALRALSIRLDQPSVLATAVAAGVYLGPIPRTGVHAPLLDLMGGSDADVAAVLVRAAGRPAMVLLADDLPDPMRGTRFLEALAAAVGQALVRVLSTRG